MKKCKKLLVLMMVFTFIITSSLATVTVQAAATLTPAAGKTPGNSNPVISHKYGADPYAMVYDGRVYLYLTDDQAQWELTPDTANSYSNCRSVTIISSADMVNWTDHGKVPVGRQLSNGLTTWASNAWAPAAAWKNIDGKDKFFLYFADSANGIGVLEADSPIGPFRDPLGKALISRSTPNCSSSVVPWLFDPAVLVDDDGKAYLYFGGGVDGVDANNPKSSRCVQLGDDMVSIVGTPQQIDAPRIFEDSGMHKFNGKYYYSYCSNFGGTNGEGYPPTGTIAYMVSENPLGPFTYIGPILPGPGVFGNGDGGNNHHAIFEFNGKWYITYHTRQINIAKRLLEGKTGHRDYRSPSITEISIDPTTGLITPLQMENKGVSSLKTMNPYTRVEAETIAWNGGITTEICSQPGSTVSSINLNVGSINNGDWTAVSKVDFGTEGAGTFKANVASGSDGGTIELRLDSADGTLIGTLPVSNTGGENSWKTETTSVSGATGVHDVYMVFKGAATGNLFKMDYWQFGEMGAVKELAAINASIDKQKIDTVSGTNTANISVTAIYTDGTSEDVTAQAEITTAQSGIVSISNGVVTGVGYGSTSIDISYGGQSDSLNIEVKDLKGEQSVKKLTVDKGTVTLDPGSTTTFKVTAEYYDGHTEDVTNKATYNNPRTDIATVANGTITAKAGGATSVVVSYQGAMGDAVTAQIYVTVSNLSAPTQYIIRNCNPVFEGNCKVAWGNTIGYFDAVTDAVTFTVNVPSTGNYKMSVYNTVIWGSIAHDFTINGDTGNTVKYTYPAAPSGWKLSPFSKDITLNAGNNTIRIARSAGATGAAEIQYVTLQSYSSGGIQVPISGISLDKSDVSMNIGDTDTLVAAVSPDTSTDKLVTFAVEGSAVSVSEAVYNADNGTTSVTIAAEEEGTAVVKAYAGGFVSSCTVTVSQSGVPVTGVTLDKSSISLYSNTTGSLTATVVPSDATNKTVEFSSSNTDIATVTGAVYNEATGTTSVTVNPISEGTATITATTAAGSKTATCTVTVSNLSAPTQYKIKNCNPIYEGAAANTWGDTIGKLDSGADAVTFTVNVPKAGKYKMSVYNTVIYGNIAHIYTINGNTSNAINFTYPSGPWKLSPFPQDITLNAGNNTIRIARNPAGSGAVELQYIELQSIAQVAVTGIALDRDTLSLIEGNSAQLTATVTPANATNKNMTWSSNNTAAATVDNTGKVTAVVAGTATITVTTEDGSYTDTCVVTVNSLEEPTIPVTGVTLNTDKLNIVAGNSTQLTATVAPANATNKNMTWSSNNTAAATVDNTGKVTAIAAGTATITVTTEDGDFTAACDITVTASPAKSFTITTDGTLSRTGGIKATVKVTPTQGATAHSGNEVVLFQLMKGSTPVSIVALERDITSEEDFTAYFNVDPNDTSYEVRAFVLDSFNSDLTTAPGNLAEKVTLK